MQIRFKNVGPCSINKLINVRDIAELRERLSKYILPGELELSSVTIGEWRVSSDGRDQGYILMDKGEIDEWRYCSEGEIPMLDY